MNVGKGRNMLWWQRHFDEDVALEFLSQCQEYTKHTVRKMKDLRLVHFPKCLPQNISPFAPSGAIIDITRSTTVWDYLRALSRSTFGSHFVIAQSNKYSKGSEKWPMVAELPASILCPLGWNGLLQHGSYMSSLTYGIALRNAGLLRPYKKIFESKPSPIFKGDEKDRHFRIEDDRKFNQYYSWNDVWRHRFKGKVTKEGHYFHEESNIAQMKTLVILLRVLHKINGLDPKMILPAQCLRKQNVTVPNTHWNLIRQLAITEVQLTDDNFSEFYPVHGYSEEWQDLNKSVEEFITSQIELHKWKVIPDNGELIKLFRTPVPKHTRFENKSVNHAGSNELRTLGFDVTDIQFARKLFLISQGSRLEDFRHVPYYAAQRAHHMYGKSIPRQPNHIPKHFRNLFDTEED